MVTVEELQKFTAQVGESVNRTNIIPEIKFSVRVEGKAMWKLSGSKPTLRITVITIVKPAGNVTK